LSKPVRKHLFTAADINRFGQSDCCIPPRFRVSCRDLEFQYIVSKLRYADNEGKMHLRY